jgi:hypothetical protein
MHKKGKKDTRWRERKPSITIETSSSVVARHTYCSSFVVAHRNSQRNRGCQLRELNHVEADAEEDNRSGYAAQRGEHLLRRPPLQPTPPLLAGWGSDSNSGFVNHRLRCLNERKRKKKGALCARSGREGRSSIGWWGRAVCWAGLSRPVVARSSSSATGRLIEFALYNGIK